MASWILIIISLATTLVTATSAFMAVKIGLKNVKELLTNSIRKQEEFQQEYYKQRYEYEHRFTTIEERQINHDKRIHKLE